MQVWSMKLELRPESRDYLGHVTAAAHVALVEEAHAHWFAEIIGDEEPPFVLARLELDYRRELLLEHGPVTVSVEPVLLTRSTVTVAERMLSGAGGLHTESRAVLVKWDRGRRRASPFLPRETSLISAQLRNQAPAS